MCGTSQKHGDALGVLAAWSGDRRWRKRPSAPSRCRACWTRLALTPSCAPVRRRLTQHGQVVTCDGHSYERAAIIRWLQRHHTSPKSNLTLGSKALVTNRALAAIARLHEEEMEEVSRAELNK
jgi:hypothetical protein